MRPFGVILALLVAAVGLAPATATAASGYCTGSGVNVVVDFGNLEKGVRKACDPGGSGHKASRIFEAAGFPLTPVQRSPGAVCRVSGEPADASCVDMPPTTAYWALFIAEPGGTWVYASLGAGAQQVSDGQTVAFAWQSSNSRQRPRVDPAGPVSSKPTAAPTTKATHKAGQKKRKSVTGPARATASSSPTSTASTSATADASATASAKPKHKESKKGAAAALSPPPSASPEALAGDQALVADAHPGDSDGGLPWWLPVGVVLVLAGGGGAVAWRRTRGVKGP